MPSFVVVSGATLRCTMGSSPSLLGIAAAGGVTAGGQPVATVTDKQALVNIRPFGQCSSTANPAVSPRLPVAPCMPVIVSPWTPGSPSVLAHGAPVLNSTCQCHCKWGGVVSVLAPGQQTTTVA